MPMKQRLFDAGYVIRTTHAIHAMREAHVSEWSLLERHESGDFGCVSPFQRLINRQRIRSHGRVVSVYPLPGHSLCVVTDLDERTTTVCTPQEKDPT